MANKELRIRELCKERGITQAVLAKRLGYKDESGAISFSQAVKRNKFDLDRLGEIIDALNHGITDEKALYIIPDLFSAHRSEQSGPITKCPKCGQEFEVELKPKGHDDE